MEQPTGFEVPKNPEKPVSSAEMVAVTRLLIENARLYAAHLASTEEGPYAQGAFNETIKELIEHFYAVAAFQLPESVIDSRLRLDDENADLDDLFKGIDTELAAWQKGGLVTSQVEPLQQLTDWLFDQHSLEALHDVDNTSVRHHLSRNAARAARANNRLIA